jgi:hypothetical protein
MHEKIFEHVDKMLLVAEFRMYYIKYFSLYLTGNTLRLHNNDQPVNAVYCENHILYGLNAHF